MPKQKQTDVLRPHTNRDANQEAELFKITSSFFDKFSSNFLVNKFDYKYNTVASWKHKGIIPFHAAEQMVRCDEIQRAGYSSPYDLRPDCVGHV